MPKKLEEKIKISEGNIIGCLWSNPELYAEYNINREELGEDGIFYYVLGENLFKLKHDVFDEVTVFSYIKDNKDLVEGWKERGGFKSIKELTSIVNTKNIEGYFDTFNKYCLLRSLHKKGFNIENEWVKFERMTTSQVFDYFEYQLNSITIDTVSDLEFEDLNLTDKELEEIMQGLNMGIGYAKHSPHLNYLTMGLPKGDLTMFASYTNGGKSSFVMNNIIIPIAEQGVQSCIVSNEQRSIVYKMLLLIYVLTEKLDYYKLNRKKLKSGKYDEEDLKNINKAREIIAEEYAPYVTFVKTYDYDMNKIKKIAKKLAKRGLEVLLYDTMKCSGEDESVWQSLLADSKELFQICSKENLAGVVTFQLALHTKNKTRYLDESCLSNGKQVAEVFSEMIYFRDVWEDEFSNETYDIKPYTLMKDENGRFTNIKKEIVLDKDKKYKIFFLSKTRNDEAGLTLLYEFKGHTNKWYEIGQCHVSQKNKY